MGTYSAKQRKIRTKIEGKEKLLRRLKNMDDAAANVLLSAAKEGGEIALNDAKWRCPVDTGALRDSLKLENGTVSKKKAEVRVDYDKSIKYGAFVELGANGRPGNPFMREAVDENLDEINKAVSESVARAIGGKM